MATTKKEGLIALELKNFEDKIKQFQEYLKKTNPAHIDDDKKRHDEWDCQIKIMNSLPNWLMSLKKLREEEESKQVETRGDATMSGLMQLLNDK